MLLGVLLFSASLANAGDTPQTAPQRHSSATAATPPKFVYRLSAQEVRELLAEHPPWASIELAPHLEEVIVAGEIKQLPTHSANQEVAPGLGAFFWAIAHPTGAWRIVLPTPPA
jgi:hypothetical protein